ncbi:MAG TPA: Gmad2 immunoglobulin-like domain-containing protein, partial [Caldilineaceae bacterium]|nr:Gmad2 immunoglobulin-like domain-containing protein [Caldilineaceae bacterium]
ETSAKDGSEIHKVTRALRLLPGQRVVDVNTPTVGAAVCNPIVVNGYSNTFEAVVSLALNERTGAVVTQTTAMGGNLGIYADFTGLFAQPVSTSQPVLVSAYEEAASGQGPIDRTSIPVSLFPAGSAQCP